jgi:phosphatidylinositol 4-kinase
MITSEGHIFHIDFGYLLSRTVKFEKAPFKLTEEFIEVMGGEKSKLFKDYIELCVRGFIAIRKHYEKILLLVEMTLSGPTSISFFFLFSFSLSLSLSLSLCVSVSLLLF